MNTGEEKQNKNSCTVYMNHRISTHLNMSLMIVYPTIQTQYHQKALELRLCIPFDNPERTPCVGSTNHTTYRVYHSLFISSRRDHSQNNVWMIIIIHCSVSFTCNAMVTSYCLVLYICICVVKNGSNFPSKAFMFIHYISSVGEKLAWFIRHLSDGLYIFHINLWNLPSDISA